MCARTVRRNSASTKPRTAAPPAALETPSAGAPQPLPRHPVLLAIGGVLLLAWMVVLCWLAWRD